MEHGNLVIIVVWKNNLLSWLNTVNNFLLYKNIFICYIIIMDTMKMTIINNSSLSGIPEEIIDWIGFHPFNEVNDLLDEHNLRISEYDKIMNAGHLIEQRITIVDK